MTAPPLTIGLPVYNGERFLTDALDSILGQTFADFTLVISDNASTDATVEIVEEYAARDKRVVLLRSDTNCGAAWNYNRVFAHCESPYFKWAAADDMLAPAYLERLLALLKASPPSVVLAYPLTQIIDAEGAAVKVYKDSLAAPAGAPPRIRLGQVLRNVALGNVAFAIMRSDALRKTRLHGNYPAADHVLLAELALVGEFRELAEPLFLRRLHEGTSVRANTTAEALTYWFDTQRKPVRSAEFTLFRQYLDAIAHAELSRVERIRAYGIFARAWARPRTRVRRIRHRHAGKVTLWGDEGGLSS